MRSKTPKPIRVIVIGAHPDDCDLDAGGTAAIFASMGCAVKFLSVTNGDAGHQKDGGPTLARRRAAEAKEAAKRLALRMIYWIIMMDSWNRHLKYAWRSSGKSGNGMRM